MLRAMYLLQSFLVFSGECSPKECHDCRQPPTETRIECMRKTALEHSHCDHIMQIQSFDKHPHKHCGSAVFQKHIRALAQIRLWPKEIKNKNAHCTLHIAHDISWKIALIRNINSTHTQCVTRDKIANIYRILYGRHVLIW